MLKNRRVLILAAAAVIGGGAAYFTGVIAKPSAGLVDRGDWVTGDGINVESSAYVHNPNPLGLNLSNLSADYRLKMNGVELARGEKEGVHIPKNENHTVTFTSNLNTGKIPDWWVTHLENGEESELEIPIAAGMKLGPLPLSGGYTYTDTISTDIESSLSSALSKVEGNYSRDMSGGVGLDATSFDIEVVDASARFGQVSRETTEILIPLEIRNRNSYAVPAPQLGGNLELNGVRIAEFTANNVETADDTVIPPGETRKVTVTAEMSNGKIDEWFRSHARKEEKTDAALNVYFEFDVEGATFRVPSDDGMTCRFDFATQILVDEKADTQGFQGCTGIFHGSGAESSGEGGGEDDGGILPGNDSDPSQETNQSGDKNDSDGDLGGLL